MTKLRILIAEDDVLISEELNQILIECGHDVVGIAEDFEVATSIIDISKPELALLDINMHGKEQGFQIAEYINKNHPIPFLFISSYVDSTTLANAAKYQPKSYITKPFSRDQINSAIEIVRTTQINNSKITIKEGNKIHVINSNDLLYIQADGVYIEIHCSEKKILLRSSIKTFIETHKEINFLRIHRSFAVNTALIKSLSNSHVYLENTKLPFSRTYKDSVLKNFDQG